MSELLNPNIDFSALGQLPAVYQKAQADNLRQQTLANLGQGGTADAAALLKSGDLSLAQLGITLRNRQEDQARQATQDARQSQRDAVGDQHWNATFGLQKRSADRQDDPTPDGFAKQPDGSYAPLPGGPQDPTYQARVAAETARAKGDVPTIIGSGSSVIVPNKAAEGPVFTNKPPVSQMDDNTADFLATRVLAGDSRALIGLGRGAQGAENIAKIQALVAQKAKEQGVDASGILNNIAAQSGLSSAYRTLGGTEVKFGTAEKAAQESFPIAQEASNAVPRTQWLAATKLIQMGQTQVNDPNLKKFLIATDTAVKDYARTINPTGVLRESDIEYARKILSTADSPEAYTAALQQLNTEVGVMHRAIQRQKQQLKTGDDPGVQPRADGHDLRLPAPPRIGELNQGYRFRGGDPADPNSWAKAQ